MISGLLTAFRVVSGFFSAYKWVIGSVAVASFATGVFVYVDNHGEMKSTITSYEGRIAELIADNRALSFQVERRNIIIEQQSLLTRQLIDETQARIAKANEAVVELRNDRDVLTEELGIVRFELLEAIRDDETFADWTNGVVPVTGWGLLHSAAVEE